MFSHLRKFLTALVLVLALTLGSQVASADGPLDIVLDPLGGSSLRGAIPRAGPAPTGSQPAQPAVPQKALVDVTLAPVAPAEARGTATISEKPGSPALLALYLEGLPAGANAIVRLHAGTCAAPSASNGLLGKLVADSSGDARLLAKQVQFSAAGATTPLSLALLADGDHVLVVLDSGSMSPVNCGKIPAPAPGRAADDPGWTGIEAVDAVTAAVLRGDVDATLDLVRLTELQCVSEPPTGFAVMPACETGEGDGTLVSVLPTAACEGSPARDARPVVEDFVQKAWSLYAVTRGSVVSPPSSFMPHAEYVLVFSPRPGSLLNGLAACMRDGAVIAVEGR